MSYIFLLEQGEESSAESFSDIAQFVQSRITSSVEHPCSSDNATEFFRGSRYGMTSERSTVNPGEESRTLSVEDFPVRTSPLPEKVQALKENDLACGVRWQELSARYDRDTHSWRTHRCLWDEDLPWSSVTLPNWGSMRDGVLYQRLTPVPLTSESVSGFWPTPKAMDGEKGARTATESVMRRAENGKANLAEAVVASMVWPTPRANDGLKGGMIANDPRNGLPAAVLYATPTARDWRSGKVSEKTMQKNSRPWACCLGINRPGWAFFFNAKQVTSCQLDIPQESQTEL